MTVPQETITIPARRDTVAGVRGWLEKGLAGWGVPEAAADLLLAVSEVCNNIIRHGYQDEGDGEIGIQAFREENQVRLTLADTAPLSLPRTKWLPP